MLARPCSGLAVLLCTLVSATALADAPAADPAMAQALFDQAKKLMADRKFAEACPKLEESQKLDPGIGTLLNLADCLEHEGRIATAWSRFLEAAAAAKAAGQAERETIARQRAAELAPRLPNVVIKVPHAGETPGIEIKRDGVEVGAAVWGSPMPVDQGMHTIVVTAPGRKTWESKVVVKGGGGVTEVTVPLLEPAAAPAGTAPPAPAAVPEARPGREASPSTSTVLPWTLLGAGAAVGLAGGVLALVETSKANDAADVRDRSAYDSARSLAIAGDVIGGLGVAAAVTGAVLLLGGQPSTSSNAAWSAPWVGASAAGVQIGGAW